MNKEKTWLERTLGLVTEVRSGEAGTALLLTANVFLLLTAYYVIKPVREGLILELESGAEYKSYMGGVIAISLLVLVPLYAKFASRVSRGKLVVGVTLFFATHLLLFYFGSFVPTIRANLGLVFYLWVGVFNMMLVAQFWAFANDIYNEESGKRLFPLVGIGASLGAALGSRVAGALAIPLGRYPLLVISAALLSVCAVLFYVVNRRESQPNTEKATAVENAAALDAAPKAAEDKNSGAFALVWNHKYLRLLAAFSMVFTVVNTNGEFLLSKLFKATATEALAAGEITEAAIGDFITAQFGDFFFAVNVGGVLMQTFVVSRIVKYGGLRVAFFVLPLIALMGSLAFAVVPILMVLRSLKVMENATDYSLNNTVRNMLWLPTTKEMKYRAKQAVDTFFVRMGDVLSTVCVLVLSTWLGFELRAFAVVNGLIVVVWLVLAYAIVKENRRLSSSSGAAT